MKYRRLDRGATRTSLADQFGIRSASQVGRDLRILLNRAAARRSEFIGPATLALLRPDISLPAYAGLIPTDGLAPIFNLFDRVWGGQRFLGVVTRDNCRDYRGGRLTYDEHDGTDFVCPPRTPLVSAAPGIVVATRDSFLRGGLTACVDHGFGVVTQYTHLTCMVAEVGQSVRRGDVVGLSGSAGIDMLSGFPWVPPHIHFMVWVRGVPVDPYLAVGEAPRPGTWAHGDAPRPSGPSGLEGDPAPLTLDGIAIDKHALDRIVAVCESATVRDAIARAPSDAARVAICEDSLHHDRDAWPAGLDASALRPAEDAASVRLTLPLPASAYRGAWAADAPWTRPVPRT